MHERPGDDTRRCAKGAGTTKALMRPVVRFVVLNVRKSITPRDKARHPFQYFYCLYLSCGHTVERWHAKPPSQSGCVECRKRVTND